MAAGAAGGFRVDDCDRDVATNSKLSGCRETAGLKYLPGEEEGEAIPPMGREKMAPKVGLEPTTDGFI